MDLGTAMQLIYIFFPRETYNKNKLFFISYSDVQSICCADTLEPKKDGEAKGEIAEHKQMRTEES